MKYLIIHADDAGLNGSVNEAILDGLKKHYFSSTSILVPAPYFEQFIKKAKEYPEYDYGIHLCLTGEHENYRWKPVSPKADVPSLVDENGYLWSSVEQFMRNARLEDVARELQAQITRVLETGLNVSHIDSHQGTMFLNMEYISLYLMLSEEFNLIPMMLKPSHFIQDLIRKRGIELSDQDIQNIQSHLHVSLDILYMVDFGIDNLSDRKKQYESILGKIPDGISQIIVHPGYNDSALKRITKSSFVRQLDYTIFSDESIIELIDQMGIKLTNWRSLKYQG